MPEECTGQWVNRDLDKTSGDREKKVLPTLEVQHGECLERSHAKEHEARRWLQTSVANDSSCLEVLKTLKLK